MTESVKKALDELTQKAKECGDVKWPRRSRTRSSLHAIIRTPEQAKRFMKMLNDAHKASE